MITKYDIGDTIYYINSRPLTYKEFRNQINICSLKICSIKIEPHSKRVVYYDKDMKEAYEEAVVTSYSFYTHSLQLINTKNVEYKFEGSIKEYISFVLSEKIQDYINFYEYDFVKESDDEE